jgi:exopolysaccharide biosynthesis operon protein EpsL
VLAATAGVALASPLPSWALFNDYVELWGAYNVTDDSNVLRLSKTINPLSVGADQRSDRIGTAHLGASLNVPISQQTVQAEYTWFQSKYQHFKDLDFTGHTARANWNWLVQQVFTGTLGYNEAEGLASFSNIQKNVKDLITSRSAYATGNWQMTPRYRASAGFTAGENKHSLEERRINDIQIESGEVGLSYVTPLDNSFGVVARVEEGKIPHGVALNGLPFDNAYKQAGAGGVVTWIVSGHSRFDGRVEYVRRTYDQFTERDYSGPIVKALYTWNPTPKLTVAAALVRDVGPADDVQTSFVLVTGGYVRPRWNVTEKITLQGNLEYNNWDYHSDSITGRSFTHHVRLYGGSVSYRPTPKILLQAGYNREVRTSDLPGADYEVNVGFLEGRIGF